MASTRPQMRVSPMICCDHVSIIRAPSPGGLKSCKYLTSVFIFRPQTDLNTASNGFMKASNMYAAPMKVTFRGLSHTASRRPHFVLEGSEAGIQVRGGPGGFQGACRGGLQGLEGVQGVQSVSGKKKHEKHNNAHKNVCGPCQAYYAATTSILCSG